METIDTTAAALPAADSAPLLGVKAGDLVCVSFDGRRDAYLVPVAYAGERLVRTLLRGRDLPYIEAAFRTADGREDRRDGTAGARPATAEELAWAAGAGLATTGGPLPDAGIAPAAAA